MGANPHANGGKLLRDLRMPDFRDYAVKVPSPGIVEAEATRVARALPTRIAQKGLPALDLIGPAPAFFARVRGEYRWQILVRGENPHALVEEIALPLGWRVDVEPVSVL